MSKKIISNLLEAQGTFPEEDVVFANFELLFLLSDSKQESVEDIAYGFLLALDQLAHVTGMEESLAQRLRNWVMQNWSLEHFKESQSLLSILVNVANPEMIDFLKEQEKHLADSYTKSLFNEYIEKMEGACVRKKT